MLCWYILKVLLFLSFPFISPVRSFPRHHGDLCDWRSPVETCDESRGLACSYKTQSCTCWDIRTIYSQEKGRCVGKSGEECHHFGGERLCTENAYCLQDESLSPIPICLCLKGYFKGSNGSCIRRSKYGEFCDLSSKYPSTPGSNGGHSSNSNCEPESGLQCVNYKCQCEPNQIYDGKRELCISLAGMQCSKSLDNCVQNAKCSEKIWAFDHVSGETKMIGHRCACRMGLKVTDDGFCAVEHGGKCGTSSECYFGEGLTCVNGKCQCHPLSQVYDKRLRRCLNLVGTKCQAQKSRHQQQTKHHRHQHHTTTTNQQDPFEKAKMDLIIAPQQQQISSSSLAHVSAVSEKPVKVNMPPFASTAAATTTTNSIHGTDTTATPFLIKSRNVTSRNFYFIEYSDRNNSSRKSVSSIHWQPLTPQSDFTVHSVSPRHYNSHGRNDQLPAEHRSSPSTSLPASPAVIQQCVEHAECVPASESSDSDSYCICKNGTSETMLRTCLLDHGEPCGHHRASASSGTSKTSPSSILECNVFEGLVCLSDTGTCQCADPMLIYDVETGACLSTVGNPCGRMKLNPNLLSGSYYHNYDEDNVDCDKENKKDASFFTPTPFYQHYSEQFMYINCVANATCMDKSVNGQFKQVCVPRTKFPSTNTYGFAL